MLGKGQYGINTDMLQLQVGGRRGTYPSNYRGHTHAKEEM
jgi:hypothetical protein